MDNSRAVEPVAVAAAVSSFDNAPAGEYMKFKAVFEFYARNEDEITFQPGDIIMVRLK